VRLEYGGKVYGISSVSVPAEFVADEEEQKLFHEVAGDIAFALHNMELEEERKRAEEMLRESKERLSQIIQGNSIPTFVVDSRHTITHWNRACENLTGLSADEMIGTKRQWMAFYSEERPVMADFVVNTAPEKEIEKHYGDKYQKSVVIKDAFEAIDFFPTTGEEAKWLLFTAAPLRDSEGTVIGAIETLQDITERKQAEEELRKHREHLEKLVQERTKKLEEAQEELIRKEKLALLGQLSGGVGHELRNPLGVISNAIYYLQMTLSDADATTKEYLGMISSEVNTAEKIVSDLLDFSRSKPAEREEKAVVELVTEVLEKLPALPTVAVTTEIAPDLPPVFVDSRQIGQVLGNLVSNAYQAMPKGGKLTISAQAEKDNMVALAVTETGVGISKANMKKIFEPLFTTRARGIGLGLAVSKNFVVVNGGSIKVESEEGKGSTFTVILPTKEVEA